MDVHVRDLRYFVAVAEELSFTRAATERLFISQPALSKQIRQLERALRVDLFDRDRRSVRLTPAGEELLGFAREITGRWDAAQQAVATTAAGQRDALRVGLQTSVGRGLLAAAAARFAERHPTWTLSLHQFGWDDPTAGLADASSDVAVVWLPLPGSDAFAWKVLATEDRWVALAATHRLADRKRVAFEDLLDEGFLALPPSAGVLRDHWLALDERAGRPVRVAAEVTNADETFEAVAAGIGVVLLSEINASLYQRPGVVTRPVVGLGPSELAVAWRANDHRPVVRDFVEAAARPLA